MADVKEVAIRLKALNADYKRGMAEAGDHTSQFAQVATVGLAVAGAAALAFAKNAADAYVDYGKEIMKLSRISGENIETSSRMAFAAQQSGVSADSLAMGIKFLEKNMVAANPEFAKLGINVKDSTGHLRGVHDVFLDTADAISHLANGAEKTDAILKIFGRSGLALGVMLNKGRDGILAMEGEAQKYGLVLSQDNVAAIQANIVAHRQLDAAMKGLQVQVGQQVLPILTSFTEGLGSATQALGYIPGPVLAVGAGLTAAVILIPKVVTGFQAIAESGQLMSAAMSGVAVVGIGVVLKGLHDIEEQSKATQAQLSGTIDWTTYAKGAEGLNKEGAAVNALGEAWNRKSAAEKLQDPGAWKIYADAQAQLEEDSKHLAELAVRIKAVGVALNITTPQAQALADSLHVDLTKVAPATYLPILRGVAAGTITAADATTQLGAAARSATTSTEDLTAANEERAKKTKAANDEEKAAMEPQFAMIDAQKKMADAARAVDTADRALEDSHRGVADAQDKVVKADQHRVDADRKVLDAIGKQHEAQRALNELLAGPSLDESDNIESAAISLEEARRKAAGITTVDPGLEKRRNALDVRRAEAALHTAEGAHAKAIVDARKNLADADQAVADARTAQVDAARGVEDANRAAEDAVRKVGDAERAVSDAVENVAKQAIALDLATRNILTAIASGDVDGSAEALKRWADQGIITTAQAWQMAAAFKAAQAAAAGGDPDAAAAAVGPEAPKDSTAPAAPAGPAGSAVTPEGWAAMAAAMAPGRAHATGGWLDEGWNLVGEQGPELVHKAGRSARVSTAPATRALLSPHPPSAAPGAPAGGTGGGFTHNGDIVIGTATERTAWDVAWEQRKLALSMGV